MIGEPFVIDAEQAQDGGVEVVHVDGVFDDVVGEIVGFPVDSPGLIRRRPSTS